MIQMLIYLLAAHALCDYALQGDFMAKAKNFAAPIPGVPWYQPMAAHCFIHGTAVYLITGSAAAGVVEFAGHFLIDSAKCAGWIDFDQDQVAHVGMKLGIAAEVFL